MLRTSFCSIYATVLKYFLRPLGEIGVSRILRRRVHQNVYQVWLQTESMSYMASATIKCPVPKRSHNSIQSIARSWKFQLSIGLHGLPSRPCSTTFQHRVNYGSFQVSSGHAPLNVLSATPCMRQSIFASFSVFGFFGVPGLPVLTQPRLYVSNGERSCASAF